MTFAFLFAFNLLVFAFTEDWYVTGLSPVSYTHLTLPTNREV